MRRHGWLFVRQWIDESADEAADENLDYKAREARIAAQRVAALKEVFADSDFEGIKRLCRMGEGASTIGWHLAKACSTAGRRSTSCCGC